MLAVWNDRIGDSTRASGGVLARVLSETVALECPWLRSNDSNAVSDRRAPEINTLELRPKASQSLARTVY